MVHVPDFHVLTPVALFATAVVAGGVDAIAGGGGLLTIPALLLAGLDPVAAVATNKLQSSAGASSATRVFALRGMIDWRRDWIFAASGFAAAMCGAMSVGIVPHGVLDAVIPIVLLAVAAALLGMPQPCESERRARMGPLMFAALVAGTLGAYDGFFGPGTGSFLMIGFVTLRGETILGATALTKLTNAASNIGALVVFVSAGRVVWSFGLVMLGGAALGGWLGSHLALRNGARLIRPAVVVISCVLAAKLLLDPANPLRQAVHGLGVAG